METTDRVKAIKERAKILGVLGMELDGVRSSDILDCYEATLDIIEREKPILDRNAGE